MSSIRWPVDLVDVETGAVFPVGSMRELNEVRYSGRYLLRRSVPGLDMTVAEPARAPGPREVTSWRSTPANGATAADTATDPAEPSSPAPDAETGPSSRSRKSTRKA